MACRSCKNKLQDLAHRPMFANLCSKVCSELTHFIFKLKVLESQRYCDTDGNQPLTVGEEIVKSPTI